MTLSERTADVDGDRVGRVVSLDFAPELLIEFISTINAAEIRRDGHVLQFSVVPYGDSRGYLEVTTWNPEAWQERGQ